MDGCWMVGWMMDEWMLDGWMMDGCLMDERKNRQVVIIFPGTAPYQTTCTQVFITVCFRGADWTCTKDFQCGRGTEFLRTDDSLRGKEGGRETVKLGSAEESDSRGHMEPSQEVSGCGPHRTVPDCYRPLHLPLPPEPPFCL